MQALVDDVAAAHGLQDTVDALQIEFGSTFQNALFKNNKLTELEELDLVAC